MKLSRRKLVPFSARWAAACTGAAALTILLGAGPAFAVHDLGVFELDGNASDSSFANPPDDWETLYSDTGSATTTTDPKKEGGNLVVEDPAPGSIFTGGGSKDENNINQWRHKNGGGFPDKDDITNAYAANYVVSGNQIIYFGADRFANDGDALMGFWFFQNAITANPNGTFSGSHANGDVFIIASFTGGGDIAIEQVLKWDTTCPRADKNLTAGNCGGTNLRIVIPEGAATCGISAGDSTCAIANSGNQTSPWPYTPKSGTAGTFPDASFFEGGINITQVFGSAKCFSSFLAETRSSSSVDAVLKDFVLSSFNVCAVDAKKTCVNDSEADDTLNAVKYNIRGCAINAGSGDITNITLVNSIGGGASTVPGDLTWYSPPTTFNPTTDCTNSSALFEVVDGDGTGDGTPVDPSTYTVTPGKALVYQFTETAPSEASDIVTIDATGTDGSAINAAPSNLATCPPRLFSAALSVTKTCNANLEVLGSNVVVKIAVNGQVCNEGEVQLTGVSLTDVPDFTNVSLESSTLAPKGMPGQCAGYTAYYYPNSIPTGNICPFSDTVTATATAPAGSTGANCTGSPLKCTSPPNAATCELRALDTDTDCATGPLGD